MWLLLVILFGLLVLGAPIGVALGAACVAYLLAFTSMPPDMITQSFFFFINHYTFMAVPFFIVAGFLMERTGLAGQLFDLASACLGWLKGGLGAATVVTCMVLAALTGSSVAEASVMSVVAIPRMREKGYSEQLSSGIVCSAGSLGQLIPPSIWMILFGLVTNTSVASLFFAGLIPGIILGTLLMILALILAQRENVVVSPFILKRAVRGLKSSIAGLGMPVMVLGGLYGGIFTPTEAGAAACAYALIYGFIIRRGAFLKELLPISSQALKLTAMVFFLVGSVGIFQFVGANEYWPQKFTEAVVGLGLNATQFIFLYMAVILVLGCFLDGAAMILLTVPVVFPVATALGVNPLHLGVLLVLNCELGVITPPVGLNLYAVSGITKFPVSKVLIGTAPFFLMIMAFLVFIVFFPNLAEWLPGLVFKPVFGS